MKKVNEAKRMVALLNQSRRLYEQIEDVLKEELGEEDYKRLKKLFYAMHWALNLASHHTLKGRERGYKRLQELREEVRRWLGR